MNLKNVEVIETPTQDKSWFQKFRTNRTVTAAVVATTGVAASSANAADPVIPDFLAPAANALTGIATSLGGLFAICIGIILVIIAFTNSKGGLKRAG